MHETCDITDHAWALAYMLQATGDARYADRIEQVIFNALPGSLTKDFRALQYLSCTNQVVATSTSNQNIFMRGLNWMISARTTKCSAARQRPPRVPISSEDVAARRR
jgi:hypothetical protein